MIAALEDGWPMPPAFFIAFLSSVSSAAIYFCTFSIALSSVACVNLAGGLLTISCNDFSFSFSFCPAAIFGKGASFGFENNTVKPGFNTFEPVHENLIPLSDNTAFVFSSSSGGIKIARNLLNIISQIFISSPVRLLIAEVSPVGISASCEDFCTSASLTNLLLACADLMASGVMAFAISVRPGIASTAFSSRAKSFDFSVDTYRPSVLG